VIGYIDLPVAKMFKIPGKSRRYIFGITDLKFRGFMVFNATLKIFQYVMKFRYALKS
jgi:hypothetical protein